MQIKTSNYESIKVAKILKSREELEFSYTADGNEKWHNYFGM